MAEVEIPETMPGGLPVRDTSVGKAVQVARGVRGAEAQLLELAIAHLAAGRLLPVPGTARRLLLSYPSYKAMRVRFALPFVCSYVLVSGRIQGSGVANGTSGTFRVNSDHTASYTGGTWAIGEGDNEVAVSLLHPIGDGALAAHANAYMTVNVEAVLDGVGGSYYLDQVAVMPLPLWLTDDPEVTT